MAVAVSLTICVSGITAVGQAYLGVFPADNRQTGVYSRPGAINFLLSKVLITVPQGGKSPGTFRQTHPFLSTYNMALTISASGAAV